MISGWERRDNYWTNIGSPDFDREPRYEGYLEIRKRALSGLKGFKKKNGLWQLRHHISQLLRQGSSTYTGLVLRGCKDLPGSGGSTGPMQKVRESEAGKAPLAGEQSLLHETVFLLRGAKVPGHDRQGCGKGTQVGLESESGVKSWHISFLSTCISKLDPIILSI